MTLRQTIALELQRLLRHSEARNPQLTQLFWESTLRCNAHCLHCGSDCNAATGCTDAGAAATTERNLEWAPGHPDSWKNAEAADFLKVIDEEITPHVDPHNVMIIISGGEPLMRKDLEEIGRALYEREYPWGIVTNGIAMTKQRFEALCQAGLRAISVSLDGLEEDHLWLRQHPLAYEGAIRTIRLAVDAHIAMDVITCVTPRILDKLPEMHRLLTSLGVPAWRLVPIEPMGRAASNPQLVLSPSQLRQLMDFIATAERTSDRGPGLLAPVSSSPNLVLSAVPAAPATPATPPTRRMRVSTGCSGFLGDYEGRVRDHLFHCAAGLSVASILVDGSISACTSIRGKYYQGNIYRDKFWDVWQNRFQPYRDRSWMRRLEPCNRCKVWRYCEGNGMHLREPDGHLLRCQYHQLFS